MGYPKHLRTAGKLGMDGQYSPGRKRRTVSRHHDAMWAVATVLWTKEMTMSIEDSLKDLIIERLFLELDPQEIDADTALADYGVDSFLLLEIIVGMEETFEVQFDQSDITSETLRSVSSLADLIRLKQAT